MQGLTLDAIVVDMKGSRFNPGQIYVALSRVKALTGLHIVNFNAQAIKTRRHEADPELMNPSVLCFCETWLSPVQPSPVINADHVVL